MVEATHMATFQNWLPEHKIMPIKLITTPTHLVTMPISYITIILYTVHNTGSNQPEERQLQHLARFQQLVPLTLALVEAEDDE